MAFLVDSSMSPSASLFNKQYATSLLVSMLASMSLFIAGSVDSGPLMSLISLCLSKVLKEGLGRLTDGYTASATSSFRRVPRATRKRLSRSLLTHVSGLFLNGPKSFLGKGNFYVADKNCCCVFSWSSIEYDRSSKRFVFSDLAMSLRLVQVSTLEVSRCFEVSYGTFVYRFVPKTFVKAFNKVSTFVRRQGTPYSPPESTSTNLKRTILRKRFGRRSVASSFSIPRVFPYTRNVMRRKVVTTYTAPPSTLNSIRIFGELMREDEPKIVVPKAPASFIYVGQIRIELPTPDADGQVGTQFPWLHKQGGLPKQASEPASSSVVTPDQACKGGSGQRSKPASSPAVTPEPARKDGSGQTSSVATVAAVTTERSPDLTSEDCFWEPIPPVKMLNKRLPVEKGVAFRMPRDTECFSHRSYVKHGDDVGFTIESKYSMMVSLQKTYVYLKNYCVGGFKFIRTIKGRNFLIRIDASKPRMASLSVFVSGKIEYRCKFLCSKDYYLAYKYYVGGSAFPVSWLFTYSAPKLKCYLNHMYFLCVINNHVFDEKAHDLGSLPSSGQLLKHIARVFPQSLNVKISGYFRRNGNFHCELHRGRLWTLKAGEEKIGDDTDERAKVLTDLQMHENLERAMRGNFGGREALINAALDRDTIEYKNALKALNESKPAVVVPFYMNEKTQSNITRNYPQYNLKFTHTTHSNHAAAASSRLLENITLTDACGSGFSDVGGSPYYHQRNGREYEVHVCRPVYDFKDAQRKVCREHSMRKFCDSLSFAEKQKLSANMSICGKVMGECTHPSKALMMVQVYDASTVEVAAAMHAKGADVAYITMVTPGELFDDRSVFLVEDLDCEVSMEGDRITYKFGSSCYTHSLSNLRNWMRTVYLIDYGCLFSFEMYETRMSVNYYKVTKSSYSPSINSVRWLRYKRVGSDTVKVKLPRFDTRNRICKSGVDILYLDAAFVKRVFEFTVCNCSVVNSKTFEWVLNYVKSNLSRVVISGKLVHRDVKLPLEHTGPFSAVILAAGVKSRQHMEALAKNLQMFSGELGFLASLKFLIAENIKQIRELSSAYFTNMLKNLLSNVMDFSFIDVTNCLETVTEYVELEVKVKVAGFGCFDESSEIEVLRENLNQSALVQATAEVVNEVNGGGPGAQKNNRKTRRGLLGSTPAAGLRGGARPNMLDWLRISLVAVNSYLILPEHRSPKIFDLVSKNLHIVKKFESSTTTEFVKFLLGRAQALLSRRIDSLQKSELAGVVKKLITVVLSIVSLREVFSMPLYTGNSAFSKLKGCFNHLLALSPDSMHNDLLFSCLSYCSSVKTDVFQSCKTAFCRVISAVCFPVGCVKSLGEKFLNCVKVSLNFLNSCCNTTYRLSKKFLRAMASVFESVVFEFDENYPLIEGLGMVVTNLIFTVLAGNNPLKSKRAFASSFVRRFFLELVAILHTRVDENSTGTEELYRRCCASIFSNLCHRGNGGLYDVLCLSGVVPMVSRKILSLIRGEKNISLYTGFLSYSASDFLVLEQTLRKASTRFHNAVDLYLSEKFSSIMTVINRTYMGKFAVGCSELSKRACSAVNNVIPSMLKKPQEGDDGDEVYFDASENPERGGLKGGSPRNYSIVHVYSLISNFVSRLVKQSLSMKGKLFQAVQRVVKKFSSMLNFVKYQFGVDDVSESGSSVVSATTSVASSENSVDHGDQCSLALVPHRYLFEPVVVPSYSVVGSDDEIEEEASAEVIEVFGDDDSFFDPRSGRPTRRHSRSQLDADAADMENFVRTFGFSSEMIKDLLAEIEGDAEVEDTSRAPGLRGGRRHANGSISRTVVKICLKILKFLIRNPSFFVLAKGGTTAGLSTAELWFGRAQALLKPTSYLVTLLILDPESIVQSLRKYIRALSSFSSRMHRLNLSNNALNRVFLGSVDAVEAVVGEVMFILEFFVLKYIRSPVYGVVRKVKSKLFDTVRTYTPVPVVSGDAQRKYATSEAEALRNKEELIKQIKLNLVSASVSAVVNESVLKVEQAKGSSASFGADSEATDSDSEEESPPVPVQRDCKPTPERADLTKVASSIPNPSPLVSEQRAGTSQQYSTYLNELNKSGKLCAAPSYDVVTPYRLLTNSVREFYYLQQIALFELHNRFRTEFDKYEIYSFKRKEMLMDVDDDTFVVAEGDSVAQGFNNSCSIKEFGRHEFCFAKTGLIRNSPSLKCNRLYSKHMEFLAAERFLQGYPGFASFSFSNPVVCMLYEAPPGGGKTTSLVQLLVQTVRSGTAVLALSANKLSREEIVKKVNSEFDNLDMNIKAEELVFTMDSYMMNHRGMECTLLLLDECYMVHAGLMVACIEFSSCSVSVLFGDSRQIHFIDRSELVKPEYSDVDHVFCGMERVYGTTSYRCPWDVCAWLSTFYPKKIASVNEGSEGKSSMDIVPIDNCDDVQVLPDAKYVTYLQSEKIELQRALAKRGYRGEVNTVHEVQGETFRSVCLVRTKFQEDEPFKSDRHITVALSRHTHSLKYFVLSSKSNDMTSECILRAKHLVDQFRIHPTSFEGSTLKLYVDESAVDNSTCKAHSSPIGVINDFLEDVIPGSTSISFGDPSAEMSNEVFESGADDVVIQDCSGLDKGSAHGEQRV
ncbi:polyprotein 1a [Arracacha virus 1]|uniref:Polyprotein 1a n=1 Tax=Arracacha virus 1 TaxID=2201042 RepID=A0A2U8JH86_9CLOS|nr:polyprotein 1a [Arracacha virus 1]AWK68092.1 polyprotein 1a [Arracacha virus 1]